ncbi:hypothetical protein HYH02_002647 [Chlamydomonas schloesseri]|uniref:Sugar phosphate transporter domain-containing protein n=1 Tax=Chlamydomonas schloesseri TaxID=2026947 RepID=A0A835WS38_9CHLO|nr:hypothetical protein HYH02_002647 [Chlamydomonas schloesseri]|eukprot:KAG2452404.1 hypothetical protein HYH02_002647 [Chlamydomonas schloesseri]
MSALQLKSRIVPSLAAKHGAFCPPLLLKTSSRRVARASGRSAVPLRSAVSGVSSRRPLTCLAVAASAGDVSDGSSHSELMQTLVLGSMFAGWYAANIAFNIYNKQLLKAFAFPLTITEAQFLVGSAVTLVAWGSGLQRMPKITWSTIKNVLPLAVVHTLGNLLTNMSLGAVAVSFTHTIKAMEPIFSVALSAAFLGDQPSPLVLATLLPIIGGVAMASMTEATFNWFGFLSAMGSNLTFQSRNVLSKKLMLKKKGADGKPAEQPLDNMSLFAVITLLSAALLMPVTLLFEGWKLSPVGLAELGVRSPNAVLMHAAMAGLCFHLYQQVSYMILSRVSPVTHSIGNCVKRVVVIAASVLFFRNPVSLQNALGTALALAGVFLYGTVKRQQAIAAGKKVSASE